MTEENTFKVSTLKINGIEIECKDFKLELSSNIVGYESLANLINFNTKEWKLFSDRKRNLSKLKKEWLKEKIKENVFMLRESYAYLILGSSKKEFIKIENRLKRTIRLLRGALK